MAERRIADIGPLLEDLKKELKDELKEKKAAASYYAAKIREVF